LANGSGKSAAVALIVVYIVIPVFIGALSSTDWWQGITADTAAAHARAEALFDPIPD